MLERPTAAGAESPPDAAESLPVRLPPLPAEGRLLQRQVNQLARHNLRSYFSNPEPNVDRIVDWLRELGSDAPETLRSIRAVEREESLRQLAATAAGRRILDWLRDRWRRYGNEAEQARAQLVDTILSQVGQSGTIQPGDQANVDRLNAAFASDPHHAEYLRTTVTVRGDAIPIVPLRLPVVAKPPVPQDGGVYWDPGIPAEGGTIGSLHSVYMAFGRRSVELDGQPPSTEWLQSVFWHEYQHYVQWFELRRQSLEHDFRNDVLSGEYRTAAAPVNQEIEATSFQLADALVRVSSDREVAGIIGYLADHMGQPGRAASFVAQAVARILAPIRSDAPRLQRLIRLLDRLNPTAHYALMPLLNAAQAALAALPPAAAPTPAPGRRAH